MYVFELEELKARDLPGISKAVDICLSRLIYPRDMLGWKEGDNKIKIEKHVHKDALSGNDLICPASEPDENGIVVLEYAYDLVALRYIYFLMKKKVAEVTGIEATSNDDVDWDYHHKKEN